MRPCSCLHAVACLLGAVVAVSAIAAEPDEPTLLERLRSEDADERAFALWNVDEQVARDPAVMAAIAELLDDTDTDVRQEAVSTYLAVGGDLEVGQKFLSDPDGSVRSAALSSLQSRMPDLALAERFLSDPDPGVRSTAVESFLDLGGDPSVVTPLLSDRAGAVRRTAFGELQRIQVDLELARRMTSDSDSRLRDDAVRSFLGLGGDRADVVHLLSDPVPLVRATVSQRFVREGLYLDRAVETLITSGDYLDVMHLMEALGGDRGPQVATQLVAIICTSENSKLVDAAAHHLARFDGLRPEHAGRLIDALDSARVETRRAATGTLHILAHDCELPIEPLAGALHDEDAHVRAQVSLTLLQSGHEGKRAVECLRPLLDDGSEEVQRAAVDGLERLPRAAAEVVPELMDLLGARDQFTRWDAADALSNVSADRVVPLLIAVIEDPNALTTHVYYWESIARLLGKYGTAAREAIPVLIQLSRHADPGVVFAATEALGAVGANDPVSNDRLREIFASPQNEQRSRVAALAVLAMGVAEDERSRAELRSFLQPYLQDDDLLVKAKIAGALVTLGEDLRVIAPVIERLMGSHELEVSFAVENLFVTLGPRSVELWQLIGSQEREVWLGDVWHAIRLRSQAPDVLAAFASSAVPVLVRRLDNDDSQIRGDAATTLGNFGPAAADAVRPLTSHLDDQGRVAVSMGHTGWTITVQQAAVTALGRVGPAAAPAVPELLELLELIKEEEFQVQTRVELLEALGRIGPAATSAIPAIWPYTESKLDAVRFTAACSLARIAPGDPLVIDGLQQQLRWFGENCCELQMLSTAALLLFETSEKLGSRASPLVSTLEWIVHDVPVVESELRIRAAESLVRIDRGNAVALGYLHRRADCERRGIGLSYNHRTARKALDKLIADGVIEPE